MAICSLCKVDFSTKQELDTHDCPALLLGEFSGNETTPIIKTILSVFIIASISVITIIFVLSIKMRNPVPLPLVLFVWLTFVFCWLRYLPIENKLLKVIFTVFGAILCHSIGTVPCVY